MAVGTKVKIPDIGSRTTVVQAGKNMVKIEFMGERFWIEKGLLEIPGFDEGE